MEHFITWYRVSKWDKKITPIGILEEKKDSVIIPCGALNTKEIPKVTSSYALFPNLRIAEFYLYRAFK